MMRFRSGKGLQASIQIWLLESSFRKITVFFFIIAVISELIHYTAAGSFGGATVNMPLIQVIVPQIMSLKAQLTDSSKVLLLPVFGG